MKTYYVYILASKKFGVLYVGVTDSLVRRIYQHREGIVEGFSKRYFIKKLVYWEETPDIKSAIAREKQIKRWKREWKVQLIEKANIEWNDLFNNLLE